MRYCPTRLFCSNSCPMPLKRLLTSMIIWLILQIRNLQLQRVIRLWSWDSWIELIAHLISNTQLVMLTIALDYLWTTTTSLQNFWSRLMDNLPIIVTTLRSNLMVLQDHTPSYKEYKRLVKNLSFTLIYYQDSSTSLSTRCAQTLTKSRMKRLRLSQRPVIVQESITSRV